MSLKNKKKTKSSIFIFSSFTNQLVDCDELSLKNQAVTQRKKVKGLRILGLANPKVTSRL